MPTCRRGHARRDRDRNQRPRAVRFQRASWWRPRRAHITRMCAGFVGGDMRSAPTRPGARSPATRSLVGAHRFPKVYLCSAATPPGAGVHGMCGTAYRSNAVAHQVHHPHAPRAMSSRGHNEACDHRLFGGARQQRRQRFCRHGAQSRVLVCIRMAGVRCRGEAFGESSVYPLARGFVRTEGSLEPTAAYRRASVTSASSSSKEVRRESRWMSFGPRPSRIHSRRWDKPRMRKHASITSGSMVDAGDSHVYKKASW